MGEFPHYFLDYRQETSLETRWQDRVTSQTDEWPGNVFGFYQRAYEKMRQALKVPFKLDENSLRIDETSAHEALREAIANCLTNADYNERRGVVFLWQEHGLKLSNPGGFRVSVEDAYEAAMVLSCAPYIDKGSGLGSRNEDACWQGMHRCRGKHRHHSKR